MRYDKDQGKYVFLNDSNGAVEFYDECRAEMDCLFGSVSVA